MSEVTKVFSRENIPGDDWGWDVYRKKALTSAVRIEGPFVVETSKGPLRCADGFLCMDVRGYPYPIAADEFALIYERAEDSE